MFSVQEYRGEPAHICTNATGGPRCDICFGPMKGNAMTNEHLVKMDEHRRDFVTRLQDYIGYLKEELRINELILKSVEQSMSDRGDHAAEQEHAPSPPFSQSPFVPHNAAARRGRHED